MASYSLAFRDKFPNGLFTVQNDVFFGSASFTEPQLYEALCDAVEADKADLDAREFARQALEDLGYCWL